MVHLHIGKPENGDVHGGGNAPRLTHVVYNGAPQLVQTGALRLAIAHDGAPRLAGIHVGAPRLTHRSSRIAEQSPFVGPSATSRDATA